MTETQKYTWKLIWEGLLHSYSQIFFSLDKVFAVVLLLCSFIDPYVGISAIVAGLIAILTAYFLGFDHKNIREGMYSFNSVMVGMVMAVYYDMNVPFILLLVLMSVFTLFFTLAINAQLSKYGLPIMSIPFLFGVWTVLLVGREFGGLQLTERGIYTINELWSYGGEALVNFYDKVDNLPIPDILDVYLRSLGAIFFQFNILAGLVIMIGLIRFSRIAFVLSLIGFFSGYLFFSFMEGQFSHLHYSYIGFNFILSAIALGGFFTIPSRGTFLMVALASPVIAILIAAIGNVFAVVQLPIYSLPYNVLVLVTLYVLKLRLAPKGLTPIVEQSYSPEINLYRFLNQQERYANDTYFHIYLPFYGEWTVSQGHDGEITHKGEWKEAFDFVIEDEEGKTYRNPGTQLEDFYGFNRPVVAPQAGWVAAVQSEIEENAIGDVNLDKNWGNTVVIRHGDGMFTQLSHLKKDSIKVAVGDPVKKGQVVASLGNSGRSPEPHIHFQMQATPYIGSKTMKYPVAYYMEKTADGLKFHAFDYPQEGQTISNIKVDPLLKKAFNLIPGMVLNLESDGKKFKWEVFTDAYNSTYIYCHRSEAIAYFVNNETLFYFTRFIGDKKSPLFEFYTGVYKVMLGFYRDLKVTDHFPVNDIYSGFLKGLLDIASPFYPVVKVEYEVSYDEIDDSLEAEWMKLSSSLKVKALGNVQRQKDFRIELDSKGISKFIIGKDGNEKVFTCEVR
ncbi:MAG: peptidoglycan DD-metalloendopeptidase family protein [Flavobacteriales bacterium]|nr:peptidoglycan DD-metalloendopeptidase family protein [Flavobacteriales bacterium]